MTVRFDQCHVKFKMVLYLSIDNNAVVKSKLNFFHDKIPILPGRIGQFGSNSDKKTIRSISLTICAFGQAVATSIWELFFPVIKFENCPEVNQVPLLGAIRLGTTPPFRKYLSNIKRTSRVLAGFVANNFTNLRNASITNKNIFIAEFDSLNLWSIMVDMKCVHW